MHRGKLIRWPRSNLEGGGALTWRGRCIHQVVAVMDEMLMDMMSTDNRFVRCPKPGCSNAIEREVALGALPTHAPDGQVRTRTHAHSHEHAHAHEHEHTCAAASAAAPRVASVLAQSPCALFTRRNDPDRAASA